jgi:hypothetical protein
MICVSGLTAVAVLDVLLVVADVVPISPATVAVDCVGTCDVKVVNISPAKAEKESVSVKIVAAIVSLSCFMIFPLLMMVTGRASVLKQDTANSPHNKRNDNAKR